MSETIEKIKMDIDTNDRFNNLIYYSEISIDHIKNYIEQIVSSRIFYIINNKKYYSCVWMRTPIVEYKILYPIFQCLSNTMQIEYLPETDPSYGVMSCNWLLGTLFEPTYSKQSKKLDTIVMIPANTHDMYDDTYHTSNTSLDCNDRV